MSYLLNIEKEKLKELKLLAAREGTTIKSILEKQIDDYLKVHKDGNPNFTIEQFIDPNFKACPAFFRDRNIWLTYLNSLDEKGFKEFDIQLNILLNLGNRRFDRF